MKINCGILSFAGAACLDRLESQVWDAFGRVLFQSKPLEFAITACSWSPNGELFAIGMYDCVRLCDRTGWSYSRDQVRAAKTRRRACSSYADVETCSSAPNHVWFCRLVSVQPVVFFRLIEAEGGSCTVVLVGELTLTPMCAGRDWQHLLAGVDVGQHSAGWRGRERIHRPWTGKKNPP